MCDREKDSICVQRCRGCLTQLCVIEKKRDAIVCRGNFSQLCAIARTEKYCNYCVERVFDVYWCGKRKAATESRDDFSNM